MNPETPTTRAPNADAVPRLCLTIPDVAEALGISARGVYTLAGRDGLPTVKLGGRRLVRVADLERWLAALPVADAGQKSEARAGADALREVRDGA